MGDYVVPREPHLEEPPEGDRGEVRKVEFGIVDERYAAGPPKACQACGSPVDRSEPHTWAYGDVENSISRVSFRAVFCDRDCWIGWASRE